MERSVRYVVLKVTVEHVPGVNPENILNEADYTLNSDTPDATVIDSEMLAIETVCPV